MASRRRLVTILTRRNQPEDPADVTLYTRTFLQLLFQTACIRSGFWPLSCILYRDAGLNNWQTILLEPSLGTLICSWQHETTFARENYDDDHLTRHLHPNRTRG